MDSDYDINELSDSKEKIDISEEESETSVQSQELRESRPQDPEPKIVESRTSIMDKKGHTQPKRKPEPKLSSEEILYSGYSDADRRPMFSKKNGGNFDSEVYTDENFLSEEEDSYMEDDFQEDAKLNNRLTKNIMENQRLKSGLNSYSQNPKGGKKSKHKFK